VGVARNLYNTGSAVSKKKRKKGKNEMRASQLELRNSTRFRSLLLLRLFFPNICT
jgi:hypothetical protein